MSKAVLSNYNINGVDINAPLNWQSMEVLSTFDNEAIQANISTTELEFVLDGYTEIINYLNNGLTGGLGIFEGLPFKIDLFNDTSTLTSFDGLIDLSDNLTINEARHSLKAKIRLKSQLFTLEEQLQALSFEYLISKTVFKTSDLTDVKYSVHKKINIIEIITMAILVYMLSKELAEGISRVAHDIADVASKAIIGGIPPGSVGALIMAIAVLIIDAVYTAAILVALVKVATTMLDQLIPVKRNAKVLNLKTGLTKTAAYLGYTLQTNITELNDLYYLPSNNELSSTDNKGVVNLWAGAKRGYPQVEDYGYSCADFFELCKKRVNGKFAIIGTDLWFYTKNDPIWIKQSTFTMPETLSELTKKTFNTNELIANNLLSFEVDFADEKTIEHFTGTNYEVIVEPITISNKKEVYIKGLNEIRFGVALCNRKDSLTGFENFLSEVASIVDGMINFFGGSGNFVNKIQATVGGLQMSTNNWTKPKLLKLTGGKLQARSEQSAKYIYNTYYSSDSFVSSSFIGQKEVYKDIEIPFSLENFLELVNNSYFYNSKGEVGKVTELKYKFASGKAVVSYWLRKPYTSNLKETFVEPTNE